MSPFQSLREYERFVYSLQESFPAIQRTTLVIAPRGRSLAILTGELDFTGAYRLAVLERLSLGLAGLRIETYSYEAWRGAEKLYWYDSQPHPGDASLASTHPHHKHIPPDIKHNRIPALGLSFDRPNLPLLIAEIEKLTAV